MSKPLASASPPPRRMRWLGGAVLVLLGLASLGVGELNHRRYGVRCTDHTLQLLQGRRMPPWGLRPINLPNQGPLPLAREVTCVQRQTRVRTEAQGWYLQLAVQQAQALLNVPASWNAETAQRLDAAQAVLAQGRGLALTLGNLPQSARIADLLAQLPLLRGQLALLEAQRQLAAARQHLQRALRIATPRDGVTTSLLLLTQHLEGQLPPTLGIGITQAAVTLPTSVAPLTVAPPTPPEPPVQPSPPSASGVPPVMPSATPTHGIPL